jgi:hypothetical protein
MKIQTVAHGPDLQLADRVLEILLEETQLAIDAGDQWGQNPLIRHWVLDIENRWILTSLILLLATRQPTQ